MLKRNLDVLWIAFLIGLFSLGSYGRTESEDPKPYFTQSEAEAFVDRWYPAWVGGATAVPGLLEFFDEEATYVDPNVPQGVKGHAALRHFFTLMLQANPNWAFRTVNIFPTEKGLVLQWVGKIPTSKGIIENFRGVDIFEFNDEGQITRLEEFFDLSVFRKQQES